MPVVGTAGHVDHGKSTLVRALTGRDPDRWQLEKDRGLTIDLGFAWALFPGGVDVSFVDVPGHERYLKNMLAGIEAIDLALLVVAADEGWMPQTEEHVAVLDLLEVDRGVVALTKADLVEPELLDLAEAETGDRLRGTSLESAPIIPTSAVAGQGLDRIVEEIASRLPSPLDAGRPRIWVDRSFSVAGAGTVVTGTLLGGELHVGQSVVVQPGSRRARIRSLQTHERSVEAAAPATRVAVNLSGVDPDDVGRGDMLGLEGQWVVSDRFVASVRLARYVEDLDERGAYQVHIGSTAVPARLVAVEGDLAVVSLARALPVAVGDRFIVRDTGRRLVVAGGRVLDPEPGPTRAALRGSASIDPEQSPNAIASALLARRGRDSTSRLSAHTGGGTAEDGVEIESEVFHASLLERWTRQILEMVSEAHRAHPLRSGVPSATIAARLGVETVVVDHLVTSSPELKRAGPDIASVEHDPRLSREQSEARNAIRAALGRALSVPTTSELGHDDIVHYMIRKGELVRISDDLVYLPEQVALLRDLLGSMGGEFTVSEFREAADISRKYAVPILEWADREGLTARRGDVRIAR